MTTPNTDRSEKPFVATDGFVITDAGHNITTHYVDLGRIAFPDTPTTILKACEIRYALEHCPTIRISSLERYRDFGEDMIEDPQEGYAHQRQEEFSTTEPQAAKNRELERSLELLGQKTQFNDKHTETSNSAQHISYGREWWIFSTAMSPPTEQWQHWRDSLSPKYDHISTIRQPVKFALALGMMLADQKGPQGKDAKTTHNTVFTGEYSSTHKTQLVVHGPVLYTDDVLSFLKEKQGQDVFGYYSIFAKHRRYESQREYRFAVYSETPVSEPWIDLYISGMMRDSLAPCLTSTGSRFSNVDFPDSTKSSTTATAKNMDTRSRSNKSRQTQTATERWSTRYLSNDGQVSREEHHVRERELIVTDESMEMISHKGGISADELSSTEKSSAMEREREHHEVVVDGTVVAEEKVERMRIGVVKLVEDTGDTNDNSRTNGDIEEQEKEASLLFEAMQRPSEPVKVTGGARIGDPIDHEKKEVFGVLDALTPKIATIPDAKRLGVSSAAWHSMWAIWNLHSRFGRIVESVHVERNEFIALKLKETPESKATGKILVGPRGTYAYVLSSETKKQVGHGGRDTGLVLFPDYDIVNDFAEFGWVESVSDDKQD